MDAFYPAAIDRQLSASLDMLAAAIRDCPEALWQAPMWNDPGMPKEFSAFWYVTYHTLFWLDFYLSGAQPNFTPPPPFTLAELDPAGVLPERVYTPAELQTYLAHGRAKTHTILTRLTDEEARRICRFTWGEMPYGELLLDTLRHTQEHGAQLRMFLGQQTGTASRWITMTD